MISKKVFHQSICRILCAGLILILALSHPVSVCGAAGSDLAGTICIDNVTFGPEDEESSHWSDGSGWKNVPGQYVAMVDYDGSGKTVSAEGGVLALAVAGVNRIGKLAGDCSVQIAGTGIVLIDSIEIEEGNTLTLHPNTAIYTEGSAAVFLKEGESYVLINGDIPGILDEEYTLNDVSLIVPGGSSLALSAIGVRTETWPEESGDAEDVTYYTTDLPNDVTVPTHNSGRVDVEGYVGKLTLGEGCTLTIEQDASVQLKKIKTGISSIAAELKIQGTVNVEGTLEGGFTEISDGGSLTGDGTVLSSEVSLNATGNLSTELLLDSCGVTVNGEDWSFTPPPIKDTIIYLKGTGLNIPNLEASGTSWIGVETGTSMSNRIGNITLDSGSTLEIVCNEHPYVPFGNAKPRYVEDSYLTIYGRITGGDVHVLGGCVEFTGPLGSKIPTVPDGYASRAFITGLNSISSTEFPLNMTELVAAARADADEIPVTELFVYDTLISETVLARKWQATVVERVPALEPLSREEDQSFTCASFLQAYGIENYENNELTYYTAVEVIYRDFSRVRLFADDEYGIFYTEDAILIRVLYCTGQGGQGGSTITHTETTFTGNGILGGNGDGGVTAGSGTVVYPRNYRPPTPGPDPEPDPEPTPDPVPDDNNGNGNENTGSGEQQGKPDVGSPSTGTQAEGTLTATVTELGNGRYVLAAYSNGSRLESLNGRSVTAKIRNPQGITADDVCYIVFDDGGQGKWIPASYDSAAKELVFEADRIGTFGVARVLVEEMTCSAKNAEAPVFRRMSVWIGNEEITDIQTPVYVRAVAAEDGPGGDGLYAVFVEEDETLNIFPAVYDEESRTYRFEADVTGNFAIVRLEGTFNSDRELYDACRTSDEVRMLITLVRLYAFWS